MKKTKTSSKIKKEREIIIPRPKIFVKDLNIAKATKISVWSGRWEEHDVSNN